MAAKRSRSVSSGSLNDGDAKSVLSSHYTKEEESDVHCLSSDIKRGLRNSLECLAPAMCFASSGLCPIEVNACISISGLGEIGLPLSGRDAKLILSVSHQAPYGRGSDTIVDTGVRQTWELNADQFELRNPQWNTMLEEVIRRVAAELAVPGGASGIRAMPYKMLLYETGSMFKEHRDSEKVPGMFGTLVICLPSKHGGGEVHVTHGGQRKVLRTAESSEFNSTYLCWYGDVTHEIKEVTAGYRLALTYNLVNTNPENLVKVPAEFDKEQRQLENIFALWKDQSRKNSVDCPKILAYVLEHLYTNWSLSLSGLKGGDGLVGQRLSELCKEHGFLFYLAKVNRRIDGDCGNEDNEEDWAEMYWRARRNEEPDFHDITDICEESLDLQHVVDLNGTKLLDESPLDMSQIVQEDPFDGDPNEEEFSGPTGNEGVSASHFYYRTAAIIIPAEYRIDFYFQSYRRLKVDMSGWLDQLVQCCEHTDPDESSGRDLKKACQLVVQGTAVERHRQRTYGRSQSCFSDHLLGTVIRAGLRLNDRSICCEALSSVMEQLPQPETVELIGHFGFKELLNELNAAIQRLTSINQKVRALIGTYDKYGNLDARSELVLSEMLAWVKDSVLHSLKTMRLTSKADGVGLAGAGIVCGEAYLMERLIPALKVQIHRVNNHRWLYTALLGFLSEVIGSAKIAQTTAQNVFRIVLQEFVPSIILSTRDEKRIRVSGSSYIPSPHIEPDEMVQLILQCVCIRLEHEWNLLFDKLELLAEVEEPAIVIKTFFVPFAGKLYHTAAQDLNLLAEGVHKRVTLFMAKIIELYASRCVGPKPMRPADWRRPRLGCRCEKCVQLDSFLGDPSEKEMLLSAGTADGVRHLKNQLPVINQGGWSGAVPEYEIKEESRFVLRICKTEKAWSYAMSNWEEDRDAAQKEFDKAFHDEEMRKKLRERLGQLDARKVGNGIRVASESIPLPGISAC